MDHERRLDVCSKWGPLLNRHQHVKAKEMFRMQVARLDRIGIGNLPTPLEEMPRLRAELGRGCPRLYVKRDDLTGLALGGNKTRKLDFLLAEAHRARADIIVTTCGIQSNWARQAVAAATKLGMKAVLVLRTAQFNQPPRIYDGNLLLNHIMGAEIRFVKMRIDEDPALILERVARHLRKMGHRPYVLHLADVESPRAAVAYTEAMYELVKQAKCTEIDWLVLATAGGGTQAGLILGAKMLKEKTKIIGINVGAFRTNMITRTIEKSYQGGAELLHFSRQSLGRSDIEILDGYSGAGYGIPTKQSLDVIRFVARTESLILDPVYTSKAMAGLINLIERGRFREDDNVCFLHTGGIPALFAYGRHFSPKAKMRLGVSASMPKKKNGGPSTRR